jgi:hypothetical protein
MHISTWAIARPSGLTSSSMTDKNGNLYLSGFVGAATVYICNPLPIRPSSTSNPRRVLVPVVIMAA